jgi:hypothetical protein
MKRIPYVVFVFKKLIKAVWFGSIRSNRETSPSPISLRFRHFSLEVCDLKKVVFLQGRREDFKAFSGLVSYKLDYTPRFTSLPSGTPALHVLEIISAHLKYSNPQL